jgi:hypothetical protein
MGIHASATCAMSFGVAGRCRGYLLGEENQGLKIMFHMMNEARLNIGLQGECTASTAYLYALAYARQRVQGKDLAAMGDPAAPSVPIIHHPDVRRMLTWMKAHVEGMRSMIFFVAACLETAEKGTEPAAAAKAKGLVDLLTPVVKAYCAQRGHEVCVQAMQVHGGYGYTHEFHVEQLTRDVKIASIYEGTDGIQAMDLLGRKLPMKGGEVFKTFLAAIADQVARAKTFEELGELAHHLGTAAYSERYRAAFAHAAPFLEIMGDVTLAWMHLWRASLAAEALNTGANKKDRSFYQGVMHTARFFIQTVLPVTEGRMRSVMGMCSSAVDMDEASFG